MKPSDIQAIVTEIQRKLSADEEITATDVEKIAQAAKASDRIEHRVLFGQARAAMTTVEPEKRKLTQADVDAAADKARKSGRDEDRVRYSELKHKLAQEADGQ